MLEMIITEKTAITNASPITFTSVRRSTNSRIEGNASTGIAEIVTPGLYEFTGSIVASVDGTGTMSLSAVANGNALPGANVQESVATSGSVITMNIQGTVNVVEAPSGNTVEFSLQMQDGSPSATAISGDLILEYVE